LIVGTSGCQAFRAAKEIKAAQVVAAQLPATRAEIVAVACMQHSQNGQASAADIAKVNSADI
jgi:hypothetical protein